MHQADPVDIEQITPMETPRVFSWKTVPSIIYCPQSRANVWGNESKRNYKLERNVNVRVYLVKTKRSEDQVTSPDQWLWTYKRVSQTHICSYSQPPPGSSDRIELIDLPRSSGTLGTVCQWIKGQRKTMVLVTCVTHLFSGKIFQVSLICFFFHTYDCFQNFSCTYFFPKAQVKLTLSIHVCLGLLSDIPSLPIPSPTFYLSQQTKTISLITEIIKGKLGKCLFWE